MIFAGWLPAEAKDCFNPGERWNDTSGKHINAHGGCVLFEGGTYYWFGEDRNGFVSNGISCYSSVDLYNWTRIGIVFEASQAKDATTGKCTLERPKVIYNDMTGKWVMYIHWENGDGYGEAKVCVAISDKVEGPYVVSDVFRPNGHDSRDQTIFKDTDGKAYHFGSTDMNTNMNVALLSDDYLTTENNPVTETKILNGLKYEAPAIVKRGDTYFGIFSGCTGWAPNPGHSATTLDILGYWEPLRNFAIDNGNMTTYRSQSTYILKVAGYDNAYIYMGDRWDSSDVGGKSEYVWLPLSLRSGAPTVKWYDSWNMDVFVNSDRFVRIAAPVDGAVVRILDKYSDRWMSSKGNGFFIDDDNDDTNVEFRLESTSNPYVWHFIENKSGKYLESMFGALILSEGNGKPTQDWRLELEEDGCYAIQCVNDNKVLSVSGDLQLASTPLFMIKKGAAESQHFGLYFDADKYDYECADMFSAGYRADNLDKMRKQADFEASAGIEETLGGYGVKIVCTNPEGITINSETDTQMTMSVIEVSSGRRIFSDNVVIVSGKTSVAFPGMLTVGVYIVSLDNDTSHIISKIIIY